MHFPPPTSNLGGAQVDDTLAWNISGACFWRRKQAPVVWCQKPWHTKPANDTGKKQRWIPILQKFVFFVLFYELKNTFVTPLHLLFLFTKKQAVLSSAQTDQSQFSFFSRFPARNWTCLLTGPSFWHQKNLAPEKYDRLTSFWYLLTGTRNRRLKLASVSSLLRSSSKQP